MIKLDMQARTTGDSPGPCTARSRRDSSRSTSRKGTSVAVLGLGMVTLLMGPSKRTNRRGTETQRKNTQRAIEQDSFLHHSHHSSSLLCVSVVNSDQTGKTPSPPGCSGTSEPAPAAGS